MSPTHQKFLKINIPTFARILWLIQLKNYLTPGHGKKKRNWINKTLHFLLCIYLTLVKTNVSVHSWIEAWSDLIKLYTLKWSFTISPNFKIIKWCRIHSFSGFITSWSISYNSLWSYNIDWHDESISSRSSSNSTVKKYSPAGSLSSLRVDWIFLLKNNKSQAFLSFPNRQCFLLQIMNILCFYYRCSVNKIFHAAG